MKNVTHFTKPNNFLLSEVVTAWLSFGCGSEAPCGAAPGAEYPEQSRAVLWCLAPPTAHFPQGLEEKPGKIE